MVIAINLNNMIWKRADVNCFLLNMKSKLLFQLNKTSVVLVCKSRQLFDTIGCEKWDLGHRINAYRKMLCTFEHKHVSLAINAETI